MRRALSDLLMSIGAMSLVVTVLLVFDARLRKDVAESISGSRVPTELVGSGHQVSEFAAVAVRIVKTESREHPTLTIFLVAATALTIFMIRT